jgi:hypothetical protein
MHMLNANKILTAAPQSSKIAKLPELLQRSTQFSRRKASWEKSKRRGGGKSEDQKDREQISFPCALRAHRSRGFSRSQ